MSELREQADLHEEQLLPTSNGQKLNYVCFSHIRTFRQHPFRLYIGERLSDMVESIRQNGILMPLLIRRIYDDPDFDYEMLSGHNRQNAGQRAGLGGALCVVKERLSDHDALMYVIETNLMQRSFSDLFPSEKAAVLALRYSEMFSQGKRNDIIQELTAMEIATSGNDCHRSKSRDTLGEDYAMKGRMVAYYLRIDTLIPTLKLEIDKKKLSLVAGAKLSYLSEQTQQSVGLLLTNYNYKLSDADMDVLRQADKKAPLTLTDIEYILMEQKKDNAIVSTVKIRLQTYQRFFSTDTPQKEVEETIDKALELYFASRSRKDAV